MCGFVAIFRPGHAPVAPSTLDAMTDALAHRGPDGRGTWRAPGVGLGHRRLAIIDLEGGAQPLAGQAPDTWIVFNGEVYNYRQARPALPGPWRTASDTEVFLRAYETHGLDGLEPLVGMWGAAIWDGRQRRLVVVRDRLGVKPVYYACLADGSVAFASEIRALAQLPGVDLDLDPCQLESLLTYRYVPGPDTLQKGIRKLLPGEAAVVDDEAGLRLVRYWRTRPSPAPLSDRDAEDRFLAAFDAAVDARRVADVPIGLFLSGGLDSAALLQGLGDDVPCFTIGFEGAGNDDEIPYAAETAKRFGGRLHTTTLGPQDYADAFDDYVVALEEPVLNDSALATLWLSRLAREHVKVVVSGQGADEPLAGYRRFVGEALSPWVRRTGLGGLAPRLRGLRLPAKYERALGSLFEPDDLRRALAIYAVVPEAERGGLLRPEYRGADVAAPIRARHAEVPHLSPLGRMLYTDTRVWLPDDLLMVADKLSMACGLELRVPFLDHRLIETIEDLPDDQKIRLGRRGVVTKAVHRRAMARRLPADILRRKKRGFTNPMDRWLRAGLRPMVETRLLDGSALDPWFRPEGVRRLYEAHLAGHDRRRALFLLLTLEAWVRTHAS